MSPRTRGDLIALGLSCVGGLGGQHCCTCCEIRMQRALACSLATPLALSWPWAQPCRGPGRGPMAYHAYQPDVLLVPLLDVSNTAEAAAAAAPRPAAPAKRRQLAAATTAATKISRPRLVHLSLSAAHHRSLRSCAEMPRACAQYHTWHEQTVRWNV